MSNTSFQELNFLVFRANTQNYIQGVGYIFSFISLLCCILVFVVNKKSQSSSKFLNQLLLYVNFSEMIKSISDLSGVLLILFHKFSFTFQDRMKVCFPQIFLNLFSSFLTLGTTMLVLLKIYDAILQKGIFKNNKEKRFTKFLDLLISLFLSYIFWTIQVGFFQKTKVRRNYYYNYFSCWIHYNLNLAFYVVVLLIVIINFCFSFIAYRKIKVELSARKNFNERNSLESKEIEQKIFQKQKKIQRRLILYPFLASLYWLIMFLIHFFSLLFRESDKSEKSNPLKPVNVWFVSVYSIMSSIRGSFYGFLYFYIQNNIKISFFSCFKCWKSKDSVSTDNIDSLEITKETSGE